MDDKFNSNLLFVILGLLHKVGPLQASTATRARDPTQRLALVRLSFCPVWVNECGYSESTPKLRRDITNWLAGTGFGVLLAIQSKFYRRKNSRVAGDVVFYSNNGTRVITKV
jgi:hypothetical protein